MTSPQSIHVTKASGNQAADERVARAAAENLRADEVAAARSSGGTQTRTALEKLSVDELRALAIKMDIPDSGQITEQNELIEAILNSE